MQVTWTGTADIKTDATAKKAKHRPTSGFGHFCQKFTS